MKQEHKGFHQRFGLAALFSAVVFFILIITSVLIFLVGMLLIRVNAINIAKLSHQEPMLPILVLLIISVVVGTVVSFMISRFPLKPLRRVIDATNRLAAGDFSVQAMQQRMALARVRFAGLRFGNLNTPADLRLAGYADD